MWIGKSTKLQWGDTTRGNVFRCSYLESKTKLSVSKAQDHIGGNNTQKNIYWGGGTPHILS